MSSMRARGLSNKFIDTIIIPNGMFLPELDHNKSVQAFVELAAAENKAVDLKVAIPATMKASQKANAGGLKKEEFTQELRNIFGLVEATDAKICDAWNAMLGDISNLKRNIAELKAQLPKHRIILMSTIGPIHLEIIYNTVGEDTLLPFFASCLRKYDPDYKIQHLVQGIINAPDLRSGKSPLPEKTLLLLSLTSLSPIPAQKAQEEKNAAELEQWAVKAGLHVADFKKGKELMFHTIASILKSPTKTIVKNEEIELDFPASAPSGP